MVEDGGHGVVCRHASKEEPVVPSGVPLSKDITDTAC
jgi:hypothetical protein